MASHLHLAPAPTAERAIPRPESPIKVILADDHAGIRRSLRLLLDREHGLEVIAEAADLTSVSRHVNDHSPHVLVLDLQMPNGSSIATIRTLRRQNPSTQIVVITMDISPAFAQQALDAGALGFVLKDRADSELPAAVRAAATGAEYVSAQVAAGLNALRQAQGEDGLSPRETEILRLIALGYTSAEIGRKLSVSQRTVESHRAHVCHKLGVRTRAELVQHALRLGLLSQS